ncbi:hypothetical protein I7X12_08570 [Halosimplex litoreum]|uniref:Uncharacterized protein n=1 Tax=Halosimplex litoreum TaxID=1198301 RepID=A0A7U3WAJ9_9EURY|nr:hypothetical protein [Halosimplex litoreum]QPV64644.1 hypothetical protein I7X12_08570 [Halosimplex litoreum]
MNTDDSFYLGTSGPAEVFENTSDGWEQVGETILSDPATVTDLATYENTLYAGVSTDNNQDRGEGQVYAYADGRWERVASGLQNEVATLGVYDGSLFAGTSYDDATLHEYDGSNWSEVDISVSGWYGFSASYVYDGKLFLGDSLHDVFGYYDGDSFQEEADQGGSCIYDFAAFDGDLYASAWSGRLYKRNGGSWNEVYDSGYSGILELEPYDGALYLGENNGALRRYESGGSSTQIHSFDDSVVALRTRGGNLYVGTGHNAVEYEGSYRDDGVATVYQYDGSSMTKYSATDQFGGAAQVLVVGGETSSDQPVDLGPTIQEKRDYASYLQSTSDGFIDETAEANAALNELQRAASAGDITGARARDAIDRLKLSESMTEMTIAGALPGEPRPASDTQFGVPGRETALEKDYNFVELMGKSIIDAVTNFGFAAIGYFELPVKLLKAVAPASVKSLIRVGSEGSIYKTLKWLLGRGPISESDYLLNDLLIRVDDIATRLYQIAESTSINAGRLSKKRDELVAPVVEIAYEWVLSAIFNGEPFYPWESHRSVPSALTEFTNKVNPDRTAGIDISGPRQSAMDRAEYRRGEVAALAQKTDGYVDTFRGLAEAAGLLGPMLEIAGYGLAIFTGGLVAPIATAVGITFDIAAGFLSGGAAISAVNGINGFRKQHDVALEEIRTGSSLDVTGGGA